MFIRRAKGLWIAIGVALISALGASANGSAPISTVSGDRALEEARQIVALNANWSVVRGAGVSMTPYFGEHSLLLVDRSGRNAMQAGAVVLYRDHEGDLVAHRVIAIEGDRLITHGLNNRGNDPLSLVSAAVEGVIFGVMHTSGLGRDTRDLPVAMGKTWD